MSTLILGIGSGQCGLNMLADLLNAQPGVRVTCEQKPLLPWRNKDSNDEARLLGMEPFVPNLKSRFQNWESSRLINNGQPPLFIGDASSNWLPYIEEVLNLRPDSKIVCLKRPREETVKAFCLNLERATPRPTDNWSKVLPEGWYRSPFRMGIYPRFEASSRTEALEKYWDFYYEEVDRLINLYPQQIRIFDPQNLSNIEEPGKTQTPDQTQTDFHALLDFVGIESKNRNPVTVFHRPEMASPIPDSVLIDRWTQKVSSFSPGQCAILVPYLGYIHQDCDSALKELERRGYAVRRVGGFSAIDQGRNQMATDALADGFEETLWIDSDIAFHPNDVEKLRRHNLPITVAIYPQKGRQALASHVMPGTQQFTFGNRGGLTEMLYAGTGFMLIRRQTYLSIMEQLKLPLCNERFGKPTIPFFQPLIRSTEEGPWYLAEDYAFCHRARTCGFKIMADTTIRLGHIGTYQYSWEDAGTQRLRFGSFTLNFSKQRKEETVREKMENPQEPLDGSVPLNNTADISR